MFWSFKMKISYNKVVTLRYTMMDAQNNVLLDEENKDYMYLRNESTGFFFDKVTENLDDKEVGFNLKIQLEPEDAFGEYDANLLYLENRANLPKDIEVGMWFEAIAAESLHFDYTQEDETTLFVVTDIIEDRILLDGNHPCAGMAIRFDITILDIRDATKEEIEQGYLENMDDDEEEDDFIQILERPDTITNKNTIH
jgi:FKBP-type peptidyl-prolyl cis-trans isomerase SlyD